jgi:hypothetical protein
VLDRVLADRGRAGLAVGGQGDGGCRDGQVAVAEGVAELEPDGRGILGQVDGLADRGVVEDAVGAVLGNGEYRSNRVFCLPQLASSEQGRVSGSTDIGGVGQVINLDLLRHGSPDIDPVVVACRDGDAGSTQREAEQPAKAESGARHGDGYGQSEISDTAVDPPSRDHRGPRRPGYLSSNKDAGTRLQRLHRGHHVIRSEMPVTRSEERHGVNQAKYAAALSHRFVFSHGGPGPGGLGTGSGVSKRASRWSIWSSGRFQCNLSPFTPRTPHPGSGEGGGDLEKNLLTSTCRSTAACEGTSGWKYNGNI